MNRKPRALAGAVVALFVAVMIAPQSALALVAGDLDPSFGGDGMVNTDFGDRAGPSAVALDSHGRIVVAGGMSSGDSEENFALARYNPDGSLDTSFSGDGKLITDFGGSEGASEVALDSQGRATGVGDVGGERVDRASRL